MFTSPKHEGRERKKLDCGPGLTKQSMRAETDINLIMSKYKKTGTVNFVNQNQGEYLDLPEIDYHEALNMITESNRMFGEMPAHLRSKFKNDPGVFMDFIHDPKNIDEIYDLGLAQRPTELNPDPATPEPAPAKETPPGIDPSA